MRNRHYIVYVSRDKNGQLRKIPIPMRYAYVFVAAAVVGLFTITGLAGSYGRMLVKAERFNHLRSQQVALRRQYGQLEQDAKQKDLQVASLGSLASEVSALYGLRQSKLVAAKRSAPVSSSTPVDDGSFSKSLNRFYALRNTALSGIASQALASGLHPASTLTDWVRLADAPSLWPVMGRVSSSFGERIDPMGAEGGEGEFHRGIDIAAPVGTPIHATADGVVARAGWGTGYGREVVLNHGRGITTLYAHMEAIAVLPGETVSRGQVIGYVGVSGHTTGPHVHYEVRIRGIAVNPYRYMRETVAQLTETTVPVDAGN